MSAEDTEEGFVSLFDGESLKGWDGNPELWSVVDGVIRGKTSDDNPLARNEFLIWDGEVSDFVLKLEFRIADRGVGNSGVQYRSKRYKDEGPWVAGGYQADIERTNKYMGILYEERGRGILALRGQEVALNRNGEQFEKEVVGSTGDASELVQDVKAGEWQTMEIVARGNHLEHKLNGRTLVRVTDNDDEKMAKKGLIALQLHVGPEMQIEFRNIRLKDEGPDKKNSKP
ncbi:DUF1080 domain-containing protein [Aeoliella sp. ICT_H6.2]|uniref:DUF1080 domain-containing protein n=1 Tax=Aeoliella straminimaris TaxID=2954799 RepID=A0A9X2JJ10_9BACT|nr:DUF1080 domain-containing protein [Aeoliella straminimaris]MCO6047665.1 DUF1080 domain-containing protein [Aeoliella straminimaris]